MPAAGSHTQRVARTAGYAVRGDAGEGHSNQEPQSNALRAQLCATCYYPFGEPVGSGCSLYESFQYEGLYTDAGQEDGGYSATRRRYSNIYYRWFSPDPGGMKVVSLANPQTWNMYAYVTDNPTTLNDPTGLHGQCSASVANSHHGCKAANPNNVQDPTLADGAFSALNALVDDAATTQAPPDTLIASGAAQDTNETDAGSGVCSSTGCMKVFKAAADFSAGAGDVLSLGGTYLARKYIFKSDSVVTKASVGYVAGAATGIAIGVALGKEELGPRGKIFGTRFGGNQPLLNSGDTLRVGWSYIRSTGEYVFRIGGTAVGLIKDNPHINLWPPSWWLK